MERRDVEKRADDQIEVRENEAEGGKRAWRGVCMEGGEGEEGGVREEGGEEEKEEGEEEKEEVRGEGGEARGGRRGQDSQCE